jgi:hypothetical protein
MSQSKLFDYNSSFGIIRTNPKLSGNFRITVNSNNGVWFNSMDVNTTLSDNRFKKFNITGENSYALDLYNFFDQGQTNPDLVFQVGKFTNGEAEASTNFYGQYDFFYSSGASVLVDKNYDENFSYFAPLWIKNEIPDFFVIFKVPNPLSYPYSKNCTTIEKSKSYKVVQDYDSTEDFVIAYGKNNSAEDILYTDGQSFTGKNNESSYTVISGSGKVVSLNELEYLSDVEDIDTTFKEKILKNCLAVKTFDLRENTKIGKYIRSIFNNKSFSKSPVEISWGTNSYSYFDGVSYRDGVFTRKGEYLSDYLASSESDPMIDMEDYITSGFYRNGIICPNLLNLEFIFDDEESDLYTINRYMGFYVSRNDIASLKMNGDFYYQYKDISGNENYPKPSHNNVGYYYNNTPYFVSSTGGVRVFYEGASGFLPGSDNVNLYDPNKLFYVTDKNENFYSLKRSEEYTSPGGNSPEFCYGPYDYSLEQFGTTGSTGATSGSLVLSNTKTNLLNFTGSDVKLATIPGYLAEEAGKSYIDIEFLKDYDLNKEITFKIFWPNGSFTDGIRKYDLVKSGDFSSVLVWIGGSYYSSGNSHYFNASTGTIYEIASSFASVIKEVDSSTWDSGTDSNVSIIRVKNSGEYANSSYSISVFDDYENFIIVYKGTWSNTSTYSQSDIVIYENNYYVANTSVPSGNNPETSSYWDPYYTFSDSGYIKINGTDCSDLNKNVNFLGGTETKRTRVIFNTKYKDLVRPGDFTDTITGKSEILEITKYVDSPALDTDTEKIIGFNNFSDFLVMNIKDNNSEVNLGSDNSFNTYKSPILNIGIFTFFDTKEFDFDFWSSGYGYTPTGETYRYYQLKPGLTGSIEANIPYFVKSGQIAYAGSFYNPGNIFYGATGYTSFESVDPSKVSEAVVFPAQYSGMNYDSGSSNYGEIKYYKDLESFNGFLGIQKLNPSPLKGNSTKIEVFDHGKLETEYEYLNENYTVKRSNISRIVPYINKWGSSIGVDARGNRYRLNSSPAFSPLNFSPTLDRIASDPKYMSQEWFLLEEPPMNFPLELMNKQNSYLPYKIDLDKARSADPEDSLYLPSYFTVEPEDYDTEYVNSKFYTKELFTNFEYNQASGYYETIFRGVKIAIKKKSNGSSNNLDEYINGYRGYEDYRFSAILRIIPEDDSVQIPVRYEVIENSQQKFILFVCDVVIKDQKILPLGYTGGTGGNPIADYTSLYLLRNKTKITYSLVSDQGFSSIDDIKLSTSLNLSLASGSSVNTVSSGNIYSFYNSQYDVDLREEINTIFTENSTGATSGLSSTGKGSFSVPSISCNYPWPIGVGSNYIEFGKVATASNYTFSVPFSMASPVTIPVGPASIYKDKPVFQIEGGELYYNSILKRITIAYITSKINSKSPYIKYNSYYWNSTSSSTDVSENGFNLNIQKPTRVVKVRGSYTLESFNGPQALKGGYSLTGYDLIGNNPGLPSILLRYSGGYEPLFRKIIYFNKDKSDTISGYNDIDLSFRNCNFDSSKEYFGISKNLSYTKVSLGDPILALSSPFPQGAVYTLTGQTPIARKDFNVFSSSWDPGFYERYTDPTSFYKVAGTRAMEEYKTFLGSKVMKTPDSLNSPNYITLQISRTQGSPDVSGINTEINSYIKSIQSINKTNSLTGIGSVGPYLSGVDYDKLDLTIFPNAEIIWQYFSETNTISGIIRLDRVLRRNLLNLGIKQVFLDNMVSNFGVGDPDSINDDIDTYIQKNIVPIYQGKSLDLYSKKTAEEDIPQDEYLRGDVSVADRYKNGYSSDPNYILTQFDNLVYGFTFNMDPSYKYSILFNLSITKI